MLAVIRTQSEIAQLGPDLGGVMMLVASRSQALAKADGAVIELAEDADVVYRASSGIAQSQLGLRLRRDGSLSGRCVFEGRTLRCDDSESDSRVDRERAGRSACARWW